MNLDKTNKDINQLIDKFPESIIWQQKVASKRAWGLMFSSLLTICIILIYNFITMDAVRLNEFPYFNNTTLIELIVFIVLSTGFTIYYYYNASYATSTVYTIYPDKISFEWKYFKKRRVDIPFEDITSINLVGYDDSELSTLFFSTSKDYKVRKVNFDDATDRPNITFENIIKGKEVYDLLTLLQKKASAI